jgi:hypothetical protein
MEFIGRVKMQNESGQNEELEFKEDMVRTTTYNLTPGEFASLLVMLNPLYADELIIAIEREFNDRYERNNK